jgi:hypothetical protein
MELNCFEVQYTDVEGAGFVCNVVKGMCRRFQWAKKLYWNFIYIWIQF